MDDAAIGFDSLVDVGFEPAGVAIRNDHQVHRERGRAEHECEVCVEDGELVAVGGYQSRKEDGIDLSEVGLDSYVDVRRRPSYQDSWAQGVIPRRDLNNHLDARKQMLTTMPRTGKFGASG